MNKEIDRVIFIDDIFRNENTHSRKFIYSVASEAISQGMKISSPRRIKVPCCEGLSEKFSLSTFMSLCNTTSWTQNYLSITDKAENYLHQNFPKNTVAIGYEMPPWLIKFLDSRNICRIDIRIDAIRFGRDLNFKISTNFEIPKDTFIYRVHDSSIKIEASLLMASIQHTNHKKAHFNEESDAIYFIGQTQSDASKILPSGEICCIQDFSKEIKEICSDKKIIYKPHPYDFDFSKNEKSELENITGNSITTTDEDIYSILSKENDTSILTISSGAAIEAPYFYKNSISLFTPWFYKQKTALSEITIRSQHFLSPKFWAIISNRHTNESDFELVNENMMRTLHNSWWGYADYKINNDLFMQGFIRHEIHDHILASKSATLTQKLKRWVLNK